MNLSPGTRVGPYEVLAKVGEGGMGEVYRARDTKLDRDVALKILVRRAERARGGTLKHGRELTTQLGESIVLALRV